MANKIINEKTVTTEQTQQVFDAFSLMLKKHADKINMYASELDKLRSAIKNQVQLYSSAPKETKTKSVLNEMYNEQKKALTIKEGIELFYKTGLKYYYDLRAEITGEKITDTVYIQFKGNKQGTDKWVRAQEIPFSAILEAAEPTFNVVKQYSSLEQDYYTLRTQLEVSYNNLLNVLKKIGYDYEKNGADVTEEMHRGIQAQERYNDKRKEPGKRISIDKGRVSEGVEKYKQNQNRYSEEISIQNIRAAMNNWLSGLLGGDVGTVQVKTLSIGESFQVITLGNIASKMKKMASKLKQIANKGVSFNRIRQFISLFFVDFYNRVDSNIDKKIDDILKEIIKKKK